MNVVVLYASDRTVVRLAEKVMISNGFGETLFWFHGGRFFFPRTDGNTFLVITPLSSQLQTSRRRHLERLEEIYPMATTRTSVSVK